MAEFKKLKTLGCWPGRPLGAVDRTGHCIPCEALPWLLLGALGNLVDRQVREAEQGSPDAEEELAEPPRLGSRDEVPHP